MVKTIRVFALIFFVTLVGFIAYKFVQDEPMQQALQEGVNVDQIAPVPPQSTLTSELAADSTLSNEPPITEQKGMPVTIADLRDLGTGDSLAFFVPQEDFEYSGLIEEVIISAAGSKTVAGMFHVNGTDYRFVFTLGNQYTFGTLHTPEGRYQLESVGGEGRLVSTAEINATRDFTIPDYHTPEPKRPKKS